MPNSLKSRLKGLVRKGLLSEKDLSRIYTDNNVIEELEKIKAEIDNCLIHNPDYDECNVNMGLGISYEIIKKHIAELKGENK